MDCAKAGESAARKRANVVPAKAETHTPRRWLWVPAFAGTTAFSIYASSAQADHTLGSGKPADAQAARSVLRITQAMVIGPTPPGTGVTAPATSSASL